MQRYIPYSTQFIDEEDIKAVVEALRSDRLTQGPKVEQFEKEVAEYCGAKYAVAVNSGTSALHLACLAAGISKDDEAITSPITFVASANCILYCGGKPVFADIEERTRNIYPQEIRKKITNKTKALIPVHFGGHPCDMEEIQSIAQKNNLTVIEDASHALGAEYKGSKIGSCKYSDMTVLSFHAVKNITTGEGGMVLTNDKKFYDRLLMLRTHGITRDKDKLASKDEGAWYYEMQFLGFNYRLTDIQCALGLSQLKKLDKFIDVKRKIARKYNEAFTSLKEVSIPVEKDGVKSAYHIYPIKLDKKISRKQAFESLIKLGIGVNVHYIPVTFQPYYKELFKFKTGDFPVAESYYKGTITLPLHPKLSDNEVEYVIKSIKDQLKGGTNV